MRQGLMKFIKGYLILKFWGEGIEATLMKLSKKGILIWDIYREDQMVTGKMFKDDFLLTKRILSGSKKCRIEINDKKGVPFIINYFYKRLGLVIGFLLFFLILHIAGSYVWTIDIFGNEDIKDELLTKKLADLGIVYGIKKESIDLLQLESELLRSTPEISWLDAQIVGTRFQIKLVEKLQLPPAESPHVFAATGGIIDEVIVLKGLPVVKAGDTVKKGELLIECLDGKNALGIVKAQVWCEAYGEAPIIYEAKYLTGRQIRNMQLSFHGKKLFETRLADISFPHYTLDKRVKKLFVPGFIIETNTYNEENTLIQYTSSTIARYLARDKGLRNILLSLPSETQIIGLHEEEIKNTNGLIQIRLLLETRQNIADQGGVNYIKGKGNNNLTIK